jgi:mRNA interferase RelE/StbE
LSAYRVYVIPSAWREIRNLPGHVRQRVRRAVGALADEPRPAQSKRLEITEVGREARRIRLGDWRILYAIVERDKLVGVVGVRKRPPYDYGDLAALLAQL